MCILLGIRVSSLINRQWKLNSSVPAHYRKAQETHGRHMNRFTSRNQEQSRRLWLAKAVSDVAVSQNVNWVGSVVFKFLTNLTDENPQIRAFAFKTGDTQGGNYPSMCNRSTCVCHQALTGHQRPCAIRSCDKQRRKNLCDIDIPFLCVGCLNSRYDVNAPAAAVVP